MDPVKVWPRPYYHRDFRHPFHPILHAPAPHLNPHPLQRWRPKSEPEELAPDIKPQEEAKSQNPTHSNYITAIQPFFKSTVPAVEAGDLARRSRGRPAGSKNKPKPPTIITKDCGNCTIRSHVLEVSDGCDVAESLAAFATHCQRSISILSGGGAVTDITLSQPGSDDTVITLHGRFEILSISGSFLSQPAAEASVRITVYLAGGHGQVVGGSVVGALTASGPVAIMVASFGNTEYERLPFEEEEVTTALESPAKRLVRPEGFGRAAGSASGDRIPV